MNTLITFRKHTRIEHLRRTLLGGVLTLFVLLVGAPAAQAQPWNTLPNSA